MPPEQSSNEQAAGARFVAAKDVERILHAEGWLAGETSSEQLAWCERAAALLGPQVSPGASLHDLLQLVFYYDARELLSRVENHAALARYGAREVLRHLALVLLDPVPLTGERFKEVVNTLKDTTGLRSRDLFHPIRLALTGRAGEGELDRVILLLDEAAALPFAVGVKSSRERIVEFCAALD